MAINRASIAKELLPGLNAVFGLEYGDVNEEHKPLFEVENSDRSFEEEVFHLLRIPDIFDIIMDFDNAHQKNPGSY